MIDSAKGIKIFVRSWVPESTPKAVIVLCHGVNAHGGQYLWTAEQFVAAGLAVFALDLRGRGRSEGERFYVEDIADYVSDVANAIALRNREIRSARLLRAQRRRGGNKRHTRSTIGAPRALSREFRVKGGHPA